MERSKKMSFIAIPGFPHPIPNELKDKVTKLFINNAILENLLIY